MYKDSNKTECIVRTSSIPVKEVWGKFKTKHTLLLAEVTQVTL